MIQHNHRGKGPALRVIARENPVDFSQVPGISQGKESALEELNSLIGLNKVKELIFEVYAFAEVQKRRERLGLSTEKTVLHMILGAIRVPVRLPSPGSSKAALRSRTPGERARRRGGKGRPGGEYIGHTALKTKEQVKKAQEGSYSSTKLYSLSRGGEKDFGKECIDCIVKSMEDRAKETVFILAGYPWEMEQFLRSNPGLRSRFPIHLEFPTITSRI